MKWNESKVQKKKKAMPNHIFVMPKHDGDEYCGSVLPLV